MSCFTEEQLNKISLLISEIEKLSDAEKLFLYLQLPCGRAEGKSTKYNGSRTDLFAKKPDQETTQTYTWILSHLEIDPNVSLPKQEVYDEYKLFCQANRFEPLCVADFGKAMKYAFPCIKPRRLGQRGNSRYCYSGLRKKHKIQPPSLPEMIEPTFCIDNDCSQAYNQIIRDCQDNPNECPLNSNNRQPNFEACQVMNLKIDHQSHHQGLHNHNVYHHASNGNGVPNYSVGGHIGGKQLAHNSAQLFQNMCPIQRPLTLNNSNSSSNNINMVIQQQQQQQQQIPVNQYGVTATLQPLPLPLPPQPPPAPPQQLLSQPVQQSVPVTQTNHLTRHEHQYNYSSIIQQPGTPDDDDYRHNYQDITSVNRHLFDTASSCHNTITTTSSGTVTDSPIDSSIQSVARNGKMITASSNNRTDNTNYITYQQSTVDSNKVNNQRGQPVTTILDNRPQQQQHQSSDNRNSPSNNNSNNNSNHQNTTENNGLNTNQNQHQHGQSYADNLPSSSQDNNNMLNQLSHMSSSYIDSCASPFQSPTSTPYPLIGSYLSHDIQDYYSDDCLQYSNTH